MFNRLDALVFGSAIVVAAGAMAVAFQVFVRYEYVRAGTVVTRVDRLSGRMCVMPCIATPPPTPTATPTPAVSTPYPVISTPSAERTSAPVERTSAPLVERTSAPPPPVVPATPGARAADTAALVRWYYEMWNRGDYEAMYDMLSRRYRAEHPFETWRRDHATVVRISVRTAETSDPMTTAVVIDAVDRSNGGTTESEFRGTWTAVSESDALKLDRVDLARTR
ncbi:MAG TPA: hypothetical protein VHS78_01300 [Candidatus Elarobacter sp.]|jgi:hypothetical protein|nr:hypothetical protein [Candidatus Elarobacter sp.]